MSAARLAAADLGCELCRRRGGCVMTGRQGSVSASVQGGRMQGPQDAGRGRLSSWPEDQRRTGHVWQVQGAASGTAAS